MERSQSERHWPGTQIPGGGGGDGAGAVGGGRGGPLNPSRTGEVKLIRGKQETELEDVSKVLLFFFFFFLFEATGETGQAGKTIGRGMKD